MGKLNNNGIQTATGLNIQASTLADDREGVEFYSDLANLDYKTEGLKTWVRELKKLFVYDEENDTWIDIIGSSGGTPPLQDVATVGDTYTGTITAKSFKTIDGVTYNTSYVEFPTGEQLEFPAVTGMLVASVNGVSPDSSGNVEVTGGVTQEYVDAGDSNAILTANDYTDQKDLQAVTNVGSTTFNPIISQSFIQGIQLIAQGTALGTITAENLTADREIELPNSSGTLLNKVNVNGVDYIADSTGKTTFTVS